jgi:ribonuclease R
MAKPKKPKSGAPSEEEILDFIRNSPGVTGKREIARAFGITGAAKIDLKARLKDMAEAGKLARRQRKLVDAARLPPVTVIEVVGLDSDGEAYGEPVEWDEQAGGRPPRVLVESRSAVGWGDHLLVRIEPSRDGRYRHRARVIRKLDSAAKRVLGVYRLVRGHGARVVPVDKRARHELSVAAGDDNGARDGELVAVDVVKGRGAGLPRARVRDRLGDMLDQRNISLIAIHQHGIPDAFSARVTGEAAALRAFARAGREDLRSLPLVTIDPPDARDHDDAVWAKYDSATGACEVVVAIADVAAYVRPATALDREARIRGNSVYFPDRVVPMLPERISTDLCSLREREERPALACFMSFDATGRKLAHRFARVVMRSAAKLTYEEAQAAIDGRPGPHAQALTEDVLRPLWQAYDVLMKGRRAREPLELDLPERKLVLDAHGLIERVVTPLRLDAHRLIEEFMIQANIAAAEELEKHRAPLLYRVHEPPSAEKVRALADFLRTVGISLPLGQVMRPRHFNRILATAAGKDYQHVVNEIVLRTQAQAVYAPENRGHFGLALPRYAHFTSPIRRYADLIVHRGLISALVLGDDGLSAADISALKETADMISDAERRAMAAERETVDRMIARHLADQMGALFRGRIRGVVGAGLFITLDDSGADGFVPTASLGTGRFVLDQIRHALVGEQSGDTYQLGDRVEVRLVEAAPVSGGMRFELVSAPREGKPAGRRPARLSHQTPRPRSRRR